MRILLLYGADYKLGWGRSQNLAKAVASLGHEVTYVNHVKKLSASTLFSILRKPSNEQDRLFLYPDIPGLPDHRYPWLKIFTSILQPLFLWRFIISPSYHNLTIVYGVPPVPIALQSLFLKSMRQSCIIYDCADDKVSTFRDLFSENAARLVNLRESHLVKHVHAVSAINQHNIDRLELPPGMPWKIIPNGVDLDLFKPLHTERPPLSPPYRIVYVGAINDRLDIDRILILLKKYKTDIELHFYGNRHALLDLLNKEKNFFFHGYVPYQELPTVLNKYHFGLLPYRDIESIRMSFPLKTLQYFACKLPVLAFPYKGINTFGERVILLGDDLPSNLQNITVPDTAFLEKYGWKAIAGEFIDFIQTLPQLHTFRTNFVR